MGLFRKSGDSDGTTTGQRIAAAIGVGFVGAASVVGATSDVKTTQTEHLNRPQTEIHRQIEQSDRGFDWSAAGEASDKITDIVDCTSKAFEERRERKESMDKKLPKIETGQPYDSPRYHNLGNSTLVVSEDRATLYVKEKDTTNNDESKLSDREQEIIQSKEMSEQFNAQLSTREQAILNAKDASHYRDTLSNRESSIIQGEQNQQSQCPFRSIDNGIAQGSNSTSYSDSNSVSGSSYGSASNCSHSNSSQNSR